MLLHKTSEKFTASWILLSLICWLVGYFGLKLIVAEASFQVAQLWFSRIALIICLFPLGLSLIKTLPTLLNKCSTARNLAAFRIVFFGFFAVGLPFGYSFLTERTLTFFTMPESAIVPLPATQWFFDLIPFGADLANILLPLFALSILGSAFGFKTKYSIALFTVCGLLIFGAPNMYGKINHNHHIIWFAFIFMLSPCGDAFSIDSWLRKGQGKIYSSEKAVKYGLPLTLIWLLMGVIYFFPGFWKIWTSGLDWIFTDNVRNHMYWKWFEMNGWHPVFRFDLIPWAYRTAGFFTVVFELFFLFLAVTDRYRHWAIMGGLLFHLGTWLSLNIFFVVLVLAYASFIDFERVFKWMGNQPAPKRSTNNSTIGIKVGGFGLIAILAVFGYTKTLSWPFTVYPLFDQMVETSIKTLKFEVQGSNGEWTEISKNELKRKYSSERYRFLEYQILEAYDQGSLEAKSELIEEFIDHLFHSENISNAEVRVGIVTTSAVPEKKDYPTSYHLIFNTEKPALVPTTNIENDTAS